MNTAGCPTEALALYPAPLYPANKRAGRPSGGRVVGMGWRCAEAVQLPRTGLRGGRKGVYAEPRDLTVSLRGHKWGGVEKDRNRGAAHEGHVPSSI